jgi:Polyketide cyclase / dehydrase and lipid transport
MALHGSITDVVRGSPPGVFALVTDIDRLPEWNAIITQVVERPAALARDVEWVVELKAMGRSWPSRSRVLVYDEVARRFEYRSQTDDGNPSYGIWSWQVADDPGGSRVTVTWDLYARTFWRRVLLARIRGRQLRREVKGSLQSLERATSATAEER